VPSYVNGRSALAVARELREFDAAIDVDRFRQLFGFVEDSIGDDALGRSLAGDGATVTLLRLLGFDARGGLSTADEILVATRSILQSMSEDPARSVEDVPLPLQGIAGQSTALFLNLVFANDTDLAKDPIVLYGKIRDFIYLKQDGSGHLAVDTCIENSINGKVDFFHWDVEVLPGGFTHGPIKKVSKDALQAQADAEGPFPPGSTQARILDGSLNFELAAKGFVIVVNDIYYRDLTQPTVAPLQRIPGFDHRYRTTATSCIDLFTQNETPETVGELVQYDYCLGRCGHPAIVNSGE